MTLDALISTIETRTGVPFVKIAWNPAPASGSYGVGSFVTELGLSAWSSNRKRVRQSQASIDLYVRGTDAEALRTQIEAIFDELRLPWSLSDELFERERNMIHYDWTVYVEDTSWRSL